MSQLKGKVVVLDFWASWCPDCRRDAPNVVRLYREYKDKGVVFVGISFDVDRKAWQEAVKKYGMDYVQVSELKKMREAQISKTYGVSWIPSLYVIGRDGKLVLGTVLSAKVEQTLRQLVK
ncbi:peroxiredoxin [Prevotella sp. HJM029]|uniref:peroxiredoxin family protein n=1 Tax=Prevotella sp. HJM029 TaxID=1433844 RepID=UPI00209EE446|nr:TlpA disulfide reductase family protein [Prevotella sp. HJM029]